MNAGQLALSYLRYIIAGEAAGAWEAYVGLGATLARLAHILKLSVAQNMEIAYRFERAQSLRWSQLARERGNLDTIREELAKVCRGRIQQRTSDQVAEFRGRKRAQELSRRPRGTRGGRNRAYSRPRQSSRKYAPRRGGERRYPAPAGSGPATQRDKARDQ